MPLDGDAGYIPGIVAAGRCGKHTWAEIGAFFDRSRHTVRVRSYCPGCLCRVDGTVPGSKPGDNWQQGIGLVEFTAERFSIHGLPVEDGGMVWDGRLFRARDRLADLRADVPGWAW